MERKFIKTVLREYVENDMKKEDNTLNILFNDCVKKLYMAYEKMYGHSPDIPEIYLKFDDNFKDGKIGAFIHPENDEDHGVMLIKTKAIDDGGKDYVRHIINYPDMSDKKPVLTDKSLQFIIILALIFT